MVIDENIQPIKFDKVLDNIEDIEDILEYI